MTEDDGPGNSGQPTDLLFRLLASGALGLSVISGGITINSTDDRYRAADADKDLQVRDVRILHLEQEFERLEQQINRIDSNGPAVGNPGFERRISRLEDKVDELE